MSASVSVRGLTVTVGPVSLLHKVDLELPLAGRTLVIGPNGAGKSTLLLTLLGLVQAREGTVRITRAGDKRDEPERVTPVRRAFALVLQTPVMLRRTSLDNITHALAVAGVASAERLHRARAALDDVGLGYAAHRPARRLSGGEQQRLAVARANALEPDCLLLDEPTSSLDPAAGAAIERYLLGLAARGRGWVMTTHDLGQARRLAEVVVFLHRGEVVEVTEAQAFFKRPQTDLARRFVAGQWLD